MPPWRPNYWLVAVAVLIIAGLLVGFLTTIVVLWGLTGPWITAGMVSAWAVPMYVLWRIGLSRL